jgi:CRISPR/Cas system endoribonuclease Cas6 (RAMP superfamily)
MAELFKIILMFSEYSGIGIKTSLGMGAVKVIY